MKPQAVDFASVLNFVDHRLLRALNTVDVKHELIP
jgi:hypothetical protein